MQVGDIVKINIPHKTGAAGDYAAAVYGKPLLVARIMGYGVELAMLDDEDFPQGVYCSPSHIMGRKRAQFDISQFTVDRLLTEAYRVLHK